MKCTCTSIKKLYYFTR